MREAKSQTWQSNEANEDAKARDILTFFLSSKGTSPSRHTALCPCPWENLSLCIKISLTDLEETFHSFCFICFTQKELTPKEMQVKAKWALLPGGMERASRVKLSVAVIQCTSLSFLPPSWISIQLGAISSLSYSLSPSLPVSPLLSQNSHVAGAVLLT